MIDEILASRYARAFCDAATEQGNLDQVRGELDLIADILTPGQKEVFIPELMKVLQSPHLAIGEKRAVLRTIGEQIEISKNTAAFLALLTEKGRIGIIRRVAVHLRERAAKQNNMSVAETETACEMSPEQQSFIKEALEKALGTNIQMASHVSPKLLCGVRVRVDGRMFDGSALGLLERLGKRLMMK